MNTVTESTLNGLRSLTVCSIEKDTLRPGRTKLRRPEGEQADYVLIDALEINFDHEGDDLAREIMTIVQGLYDIMEMNHHMKSMNCLDRIAHQHARIRLKKQLLALLGDD